MYPADDNFPRVTLNKHSLFLCQIWRLFGQEISEIGSSGVTWNLIYLVFIKPTGKIRKENIKRICFFNFSWFWENLVLELLRVSFRASRLDDWISKIIPSGLLTFISKVSAEIGDNSTMNHTKQCILIIVTYPTVCEVVWPSVVPRSSKECGPETYIWNKT